MPALFLNLLKLLFLGAIYVFLWQVARAIGSHIGSGPTKEKEKGGGEVVVVKSENLVGRRFPLTSPLVVGRSADADIVIEDPYASDLHLRFGLQDGHIMLHDLGSTNGTYVNGRRVSAPIALSHGDAVQVGKTIFEVR